MITNKGKKLLVQFLAGKIEDWAAEVEVGIGDTAAQVTDESLEFPHLRFDVDHYDYDELNEKVIVRATIPQEVSTGIYEVGLFSGLNNPVSVNGNRLLLDYTDGSAIFSENNAVFSATNSRLGDEGKLLNIGSGQTGYVRGYLEAGDLSEYKGSDNFNLAYYYTNTGGTPTVTVRFETTESDYYEHTFSPTAGYNIETFAKSTLTSTGTPDWSVIDSIYIASSDQSDILLDGIMAEESLLVEDYGMVARRVLTTPRIKPTGVEAELTFEIGVTF